MEQKPIGPEQIQHMARLAKLRLDREDLEKMALELQGILTHLARLQEVDTRGVEPLIVPLLPAMPLREDSRGAPLEQDRVASMAPRSQEGFVVVPRMVEED